MHAQPLPTYGGFGIGSYRGRGRRFTSFGIGYGGTSRSINRYTGLITIRLYQEDAPEGLGPSYDAKTLVETLGPRITRPGDISS